MFAKLKQLLKIRSVKLTLEILVVLLDFVAIKTYMQRDLVQGPAPALHDTFIDGQPANLQNLQGKPVLLYFWATWCPVCKMQNGSVAAISRDHPVVTVAMNSGTDFPCTRSSIRHHFIRWWISGCPYQFSRMHFSVKKLQ